MNKSRFQKAWVIAACGGTTILPFGYFDGEQDFTLEENCMVYHTQAALKEGLKRAKRSNQQPDGTTSFESFPVLVE